MYLALRTWFASWIAVASGLLTLISGACSGQIGGRDRAARRR